jgi:hypothetical protein
MTTNALPVRVVIFGKHVQIWSDALNAGAPAWPFLPEVTEVITVPGESAADMPPRQNTHRTVVLPLMERHVNACPRDEHTGLVPSRRAIETLGDKANFAAYARQHGLANHCPRHFATPDEAVFPCVVKRTNLNAGRGVAVVATRDELAATMEMAPWQGHPVVLQAYEPSDHNCVTHAVCVRGKIVTEISYHQPLPEGQRIRGGTRVPCVRFEPSAELIATFERFLAPLAYDGVCNFDYMHRADGTPCLFEINPRLGGSLMFPDNVQDLAAILGSLVAHAGPLATANRNDNRQAEHHLAATGA